MNTDFWNERYASEEYIYGRQPNRFFQEHLNQLPRGRLLLPCEGEGRNAVYAAACGWDVSAFDQSSVGREKAMHLAAEAGVDFEYAVCAAGDFDPGDTRYDLIAFVFAHFPAGLREEMHNKAVAWLRPGGYLLLEAFDKKQISLTSGGPRDLSLLYATDILSGDFNALETLLLEQTRIEIEEGEFHRGPAEVVRYLGQKR